MGRSLKEIKRNKFPKGGAVKWEPGKTPANTPPGSPSAINAGTFGEHLNYTRETSPTKLQTEAIEKARKTKNPKETHTVLHIPKENTERFNRYIKSQFEEKPRKESTTLRIPSRLKVQATMVGSDQITHDYRPYEFGGRQGWRAEDTNKQGLTHFDSRKYKSHGTHYFDPDSQKEPVRDSRKRSRSEPREPEESRPHKKSRKR